MWKILVTPLIFFSLGSVAFAEDEAAERRLALSEANLNDAKARATITESVAEAMKARAETAKLIQEAIKTAREAELTDAKRQMVLTEIQRLRQRMRITEYEFNRLVRADYEYERDKAYVEKNVNLIRPLLLGRASWKTWIGLESLILLTGDADLLADVMFNHPVPPLPADQFLGNRKAIQGGFTGGNLGQLYTFCRQHRLSFVPYSEAHLQIYKVVALISKGAKLKMEEIRNINQSIRLTIAEID